MTARDACTVTTSCFPARQHAHCRAGLHCASLPLLGLDYVRSICRPLIFFASLLLGSFLELYDEKRVGMCLIKPVHLAQPSASDRRIEERRVSLQENTV